MWTRLRIRSLALAVGSLLFMVPLEAFGQISTWTNDVSGTFSVASNWTGGVPGASSTAVFEASPVAYTVSFTSTPTNFALNVDDGTVTFDFNGNNYILTKASNAVIVGGPGFSATGNPATLTIREGNLQSTSSLIGQGSGIPGAVTVTTDGSWSNSSSLVISGGGHGTLSIISNGQVSNTSGILGNVAGFTGTVNVTGVNAGWTNSSSLTVGSAGHGILNISSGADVFNTSASIGVGAGSNSSVTVTGNGSTWNNSSSIVLGQSGTAALNIVSGGIVTSGGSSSSLASATGSSATVFISGAGSAWNMTSGLNIGGNISTNGGNALVTLQSGGALSVSGTLRLWQDGIVNVDGATLTMGSLDPLGGSINFSGGTINITGSPSLDSPALQALFGSARSIAPGRNFVVNGTTTLASPLSIDGGNFSTGGLVGGSNLTLNQGTFNLTNSNLTIGSSGQFGSQLNLPEGMNVIVSGTNTTTVQSGALLRSTGGQFTSGGNITNNGTIQLASDLAAIHGATLVNNATIRGTGLITNNLTNNPSGQVQVTEGNRLEFNGTLNLNAGSINLVGGEIQFNSSLGNSANTGLISARNSILRFNGGLSNSGSVTFSNGTVDVFGDVTQFTGGRITISGGGIANFYDDVIISGGAAGVQASAVGGTISSVVFFGSYNGGVSGGGTAFIEGDHRPGNSPGLVSFDGDVFYGAVSRLFIELGGYQRGVQFDAIDIAGSVTVGGQFNLRLLDGFTTLGGESFLIIQNDGLDAIMGTFDGLPEGALLHFEDRVFSISYEGGTGNDLVITAIPEPGTWALIGFTLAAAGYCWQRRQRQETATQNAEIVEGSESHPGY